MKPFFALILLTLAASPSVQSKTNTNLTVIQPYVTVTQAAQLSGFVYGKIVNNTNQAQTLTSITTSASTRVEIQTMDSHNAKAIGRKVDQLTIPAQSSKVLEPGDTRIALLGLVKPLEAHEHITLTLHFSNKKTINVEVPVRLSLKDALHSPGIIPPPIDHKATN